MPITKRELAISDDGRTVIWLQQDSPFHFMVVEARRGPSGQYRQRFIEIPVRLREEIARWILGTEKFGGE